MERSLSEIVKLLRELESGGSDSCLRGTPMIPLHRDTVSAILTHLEGIMENETNTVPKQICGYPLPGWRLHRVEYDDGQKDMMAPGWIVSLHTESKTDPTTPDRRRYRCVMTRSLIGPLEAWDEAVQIAMRENEGAEKAAA